MKKDRPFIVSSVRDYRANSSVRQGIGSWVFGGRYVSDPNSRRTDPDHGPGTAGRSVCVALLIPIHNKTVLPSISGVYDREGARVDVVAVGWD